MVVGYLSEPFVGVYCPRPNTDTKLYWEWKRLFCKPAETLPKQEEKA